MTADTQPAEPLAPGAAAEAVDPQQVAQIKAQVKKLYVLYLALGVAGVILFVGGANMEGLALRVVPYAGIGLFLGGWWVGRKLRARHELLPGAAVGPVGPQRAAEIRARSKKLGVLSFAGVLIGVILQMYVVKTKDGSAAPALFYVGAALLVGGMVLGAKGRGRHPLFALLGVLSLPGAWIFGGLPTSCLNCGKSHANSLSLNQPIVRHNKQCSRCGAPLW
jgi:hypothetical protein